MTDWRDLLPDGDGPPVTNEARERLQKALEEGGTDASWADSPPDAGPIPKVDDAVLIAIPGGSTPDGLTESL